MSGEKVTGPDAAELHDETGGRPETQLKNEAKAAPARRRFSAKWTSAVNLIEERITTILRSITHHAATHPKTYVVGTIILSLGVLGLGFATNFSVDVNDDTLWTPAGSKPVSHMKWIEDNYPDFPRMFMLMVHTNGDNVLGQEGVRRVFEAVDVVRDTPGYDKVCDASSYVSPTSGAPDCKIVGVTNFWNDSTALFEVTGASDEDVLTAISAPIFPDGRPVDIEGILGYPQENANGTVYYAQSYIAIIELPETEEAEDFEKEAIDNVLDLQEKWKAGHVFELEIFAERSFDDEFSRAIVNDLPLVPVVFIVMTIFTIIIFSKRDPVASRGMLGFGAVIAVLLAIMAGYGFLFICGVPFTSMTQILPFIMFGIGLDNTYIITGAYGRTSQASDPVARIDETIQTVGLSITLTTMTSVLAFGLGCISSIPAVYWLCLYAFPTLFINYLYQVTFFVALIVIDEHRMQAKRRGCCVCIRATGEPASSGEGTQDNSNKPSELPLADRIMLWYADKLLLPAVKAAVLVIFAALLVGMAYSASLLKQEFKFTDVLPSDSYITEFFDAFDVWYSRGAVYPYVYFRYVDQSDAEIQKQMVNYVNDLVGIDAIEEQPPNFWLRDFRAYVSSTNGSMADMSFNEQLDAFLHEPGYELLYRDEIIRDNNGDIIVSRVSIHMPNVDTDDVKNQVDALEDQRDVTKAQPINKDKKDWPFFTFADLYNIWQFYAVAVGELIFTTIVGVVAVTGVATIFIPHWTAGVFTMPLISILYVDLLGFLQLAGAHVNAVSYIALVMSIGLLVDFVVHILLRFYETTGTREEKVRETLRTMGSSILTGAVSTFLGIIPLGFSTSEIFSTVFNAFIGLVVLGSTHGLILLPVVLSLIGPVECIKAEKEAADDPAETSDSLQTESVKAEKEAAEDPADTTDSIQAEIDV